MDLDDMVLAHAVGLRARWTLKVDTAGVCAARVEGACDQLGRAVGNLAENAARHAATQVTFTLVEHRDTVVLSVGDDGPGIPLAARESVFERFARLDNARSTGSGGIRRLLSW